MKEAIAKHGRSIRALIQAVIEAGANAGREVGKAAASVARGTWERVTDPLTVGGTLLVAGSMTMMMRDDLLKALHNHDLAVAAAQAEHDAKVAQVTEYVRRLDETQEFMIDGFPLYVDAPRSVSHAEHLYVILNDIRQEHWQAAFDHLRSCGIAVDGVLLTDPDIVHPPLLHHEKDGEKQYVHCDSPFTVARGWNRQYWQEDPEYFDLRKGTKNQKIAQAIEKFRPERPGEHKRRTVSIIIHDSRATKNEPDARSFFDELAKKDNKFAVAHISKVAPIDYAQKKAARKAAKEQEITAAPPRTPTMVAADDPVASVVTAPPPLPPSIEFPIDELND